MVIFTRYELYNYDDIYNEVSGGFETGLAHFEFRAHFACIHIQAFNVFSIPHMVQAK